MPPSTEETIQHDAVGRNMQRRVTWADEEGKSGHAEYIEPNLEPTQFAERTPDYNSSVSQSSMGRSSTASSWMTEPDTPIHGRQELDNVFFGPIKGLFNLFGGDRKRVRKSDLHQRPPTAHQRPPTAALQVPSPGDHTSSSGSSEGGGRTPQMGRVDSMGMPLAGGASLETVDEDEQHESHGHQLEHQLTWS